MDTRFVVIAFMVVMCIIVTQIEANKPVQLNRNILIKPSEVLRAIFYKESVIVPEVGEDVAETNVATNKPISEYYMVSRKGKERFIFNPNDLRVPCGLTGEQLESHLRGGLVGLGDEFAKAEKENGINAIFLISLSRLESGNGSYKYMDRNNIFSWGANTNSPDDAIHFNSIKDCIMTVSERLSVRLDKRGSWSMDSVSKLYNAADDEWADKILEIVYN